MAFPQNIGPCNITYKGNSLGKSHGDVIVKYEEQFKDIQYNQMGSGPADGVITGVVAEVTVPMTATSFAELNYVLHGASGSPGSLTLSNAVGKEGLVNSGTLILTLIENGSASADTDDILTVAYAFPVSNTDWAFSAENDQRVTSVTFKVFPNASTGAYMVLGTA